MPSLLAKAAMMALGATGDRRLSGVSPCTHDACGRPRMLLAYESATGDPKFLDGANYDSTTRELYAPANGIPGLTENDAKSYITINNNGKVEVHVHLDDSQGYDHDQLQCSLAVETTVRGAVGPCVLHCRAEQLSRAGTLRCSSWYVGPVSAPGNSETSMGTMAVSNKLLVVSVDYCCFYWLYDMVNQGTQVQVR